jgi:hypothetical protein
MKIVFTGCSAVAGKGFNPNDIEADCKDNPILWVNLAHKNISQFLNLEIENLAVSGSSNSDVFVASVDAISKNNLLPDQDKIKYMLVSMTRYPRHNCELGFETYPTRLNFATHKVTDDVHLNNYTWPKKQLEDLVLKYRLAHHPQQGIVEVLRYCNILERLAKAQNIEIYFVNQRLPWDKDYFVRLDRQNARPADYTEFTRNSILFVDNREDDEIYQLYDKMHDEYQAVGGINTSRWINLYRSWDTEKIDVNFDFRHAGIKSHQKYFQIVNEFFKDLQ